MRITGWIAGALALLSGVLSSSAIATELPITARSAIAIDAATGEVLWSRDPDLQLPPASTTKVMTAIMAIESGQLQDEFEVSPVAASTPPSSIHLQSGQRMRLLDLLYAVLLKSANDASAVVAEGIAGSQAAFAARMTAKAHRIGAVDTTFLNPHGLHVDGHVTTTRDLVRIFRYGLRLPLFREILSARSADIPVEDVGTRMIEVRSHNKLLTGYSYPVIGKTGYTRPARRCFVGAASGSDREIIFAILGASDLWGDARKIIEYSLEGKTSFDTSPVVPARYEAPAYDAAATRWASRVHRLPSSGGASRRHGRSIVVVRGKRVSRDTVVAVRGTSRHGRAVASTKTRAARTTAKTASTKAAKQTASTKTTKAAATKTTSAKSTRRGAEPAATTTSRVKVKVSASRGSDVARR